MILLVTPTRPDSQNGNGVTARRWAGILRHLGVKVRLRQDYQDGRYRALLALHAVKSAPSIRAFHAEHPHAPVIIALTGTDLYPSLSASGVDPSVVGLASRLVVLQQCGLSQIPGHLIGRTKVIIQSVADIPPARARADCFEVAFLAHLRPVKDPLLLAAAVRLLPPTSRIRVTHVGDASDPDLGAAARDAETASDRYQWLGPLPRRAALTILARGRLLALTSVQEGGANVISEALAAAVPVISSRIPGSVGLLGADYPGYFRPGDPADLARVLRAAETDGTFLNLLHDRCAALRPMIDPAREHDAWRSLLAELDLL